MIKTPINLQDLRRKIYAKAKVDKAWRFWACVLGNVGASVGPGGVNGGSTSIWGFSMATGCADR
jgi:hypothetical protein